MGKIYGNKGKMGKLSSFSYDYTRFRTNARNASSGEA